MIDFSFTSFVISDCLFHDNINSPIYAVNSQMKLQNVLIYNAICFNLQLGCVISAKSNSSIFIDTVTVNNITAKNVNPSFIYLEDSQLNLSNSLTTQINSAGFGSCIFSYGSVLNLNASDFINCYPNAIYSFESSLLISHITVKNSSFSFSALIASASFYLQINSSKFIENTKSSQGGALSIESKSVNIIFTVDSCSFVNNSAQKNGGALFIEDANVLINNSNFVNNEAQFGGAIYYKTNDYESTLSIFQTIFSFNSAGFEGGAIKYTKKMPTFDQYVMFNNNSAFYGQNVASYPVRMTYKVLQQKDILNCN